MTALIKRNLKELLRDPLSFIFCLGFPMVMLILMTILNNSIPPASGPQIFEMPQLLPGVSVFGLSFCMLFGVLTVSRDRSGAFLWRLRAAPLKPRDYVAGYFLPLLLVALGQCLICLLAGQIIGGSMGAWLSLWELLRLYLGLLPSMVLFTGLGIIIGSLFSDKAAPGLCSILISASSLLSGVWMDVEALGGTMEKICLALPFYHCVRAGRLSLAGSSGAWRELLVVCLCALVAWSGAVLALRWQIRKDG